MFRTAFTVLFVFASLNASGGTLTWTTNGPETGQVTVVRFDPIAPNVVWAGTIGHGIFRSTDGGITWAPLNNGLNGSVGAITIDPTNSSRLWTGHYDVYHSTDGGAHWVPTEEGLQPGASRVTSLAVDPAHPSNVFVGTTRDTFNPSVGVQKSIDGGQTFFDASTAGLGTKDVLALVIDRTNPSVLYAAGGPDALGRPLFKSGDGGTTWFASSSGLFAQIDALAIDPLNGSRLFAAQAGSLMKSTDAGATWATDGAGLPPTCCNAIVYQRNSSSDIWLATLDDVYRSIDGGATWNPAKIANENVHSIDTNAEATVVAGTAYDGLYRRTAGATSWNAVDSGFLASDINVLTADLANAGTVYAGTQYTGIFKSIDHGHSWQRLSPDLLGVWMLAIAIDSHNSSVLYAGGTGGSGFYKSTDVGGTWTSPTSFDGVFAIAIDPSSTNTLYVATKHGVSKSTDGGTTFTSASKGLPVSVPVAMLAIDPINTSTLYAGLIGRGVYKTTDGGATWTKKYDQQIVSALVVDRTNPSTLFMTVSGSGVFKSTNGGDTFIESDTGIPTKSVAAIWIDPTNGQNLYVSTALDGVFRSTDGGATWMQLGGYAPAPLVNAIAVEPGGNIVHAGASGGVFSYQFTGSSSNVRRRGMSH